MKQLQPIREKQSYYKDIEQHIAQYFDELIYDKIFELLKNSIGQFYNSNDVIKDALLKGQIQYVEGKFTGRFNAKITKQLKDMGAIWDVQASAFKLPKLPDDLLGVVGQASLMFIELHKQILAIIYEIQPEALLKTFSFDTTYIKTLTDIDSRVYQTLKDDISIIPEFSPEMREVIAREYSDNLKLYIKDFTDKETFKLRELVEDNMFNHGARAERLVDIIQDRFGVSQRKARFLARNETQLLTAEFKKVRYLECGVTQFRWDTSHDSRVRPLHKELNGKIFDINNPPVIDELGNKGLPGQTYNCRCNLTPIVD